MSDSVCPPCPLMHSYSGRSFWRAEHRQNLAQQTETHANPQEVAQAVNSMLVQQTDWFCSDQFDLQFELIWSNFMMIEFDYIPGSADELWFCMFLRWLLGQTDFCYLCCTSRFCLMFVGCHWWFRVKLVRQRTLWCRWSMLLLQRIFWRNMPKCFIYWLQFVWLSMYVRPGSLWSLGSSQ